MVISLYNFPKRINSTKQPAINDHTKTVIQQAELKEKTSFLFPTLLISKNIISGFNPVMFNYAYIPIWQRYYFIKDWRWVNGIWECDLSVDVLASFRSEIGETTSYIVRSASDYNGSIIDSFYPAKTDVSITKVNIASSWYGIAPSGGSYIIGCINNSVNKVGSVTYYALTSAQLGSILSYLFSNSIYNASSISEIGDGLFKSLFNPFQYIVSCIWFPFATSAFGSSSAEVTVGYWGTGVNGIIVSSLAEKTFISGTIPNHPQITRGRYLNHAPYTKLTLYIPPFGSIPIDTNFIEIGNYLYTAVLVDHITGQATIRVAISPSSSNLNEYNVCTERSGMIGVPIQLSQVLTDYSHSIESLMSGIASLATFNFAGAITSVMSAVESQMPKVYSSGANGSFIECIQYPVLIVEHLLLVEENNDEFGRPLCSNRQINSLNGFIKTGDADHPFSGTEEENKRINTYLKNGFYYI